MQMSLYTFFTVATFADDFGEAVLLLSHIIHNAWTRSYQLVIKIPIFHALFLQDLFFFYYSHILFQMDTHSCIHTHTVIYMWPQELYFDVIFLEIYSNLHHNHSFPIQTIILTMSSLMNSYNWSFWDNHTNECSHCFPSNKINNAIFVVII